MTRRLGLFLLLGLAVIASGCVPKVPEGRLVIVGVVREADFWNVVFKNTGTPSIRIASSVFTAYNAEGEKLTSHYGPSLDDGRPFQGLQVSGIGTDSITYHLWWNETSNTKLFEGVDGVRTIEVNVMWRSTAKGSDWQWLEATLTV